MVFHAAAHKHLPLLERHPCEGVKSNVLGTQNVVRAACETSAARFVLISTDKAAEPRSVLGATKRLAEMVVQDGVQASATGSTRVCSVRFGNVLGSRGSFLAVVADQIDRGEPVTVTHPEVTRFFMTVEEAVGLVLSAAPMAEYGETFVLDMGEPVRIVDLVRRYAGHLHVPDVQICFTGLRAGEKLHEKLFGEREQRLPTVNPAIWATRPVRLPGDFTDHLGRLYAAAADGDDALVRVMLADLIPDYTPSPGRAADLATAAATPYPGRVLMRGVLVTAGERVEVTCPDGWLADVLTEGAAGQLAPPGRQPPDVRVTVEPDRAAFSLDGARLLTRGSWSGPAR